MDQSCPKSIAAGGPIGENRGTKQSEPHRRRGRRKATPPGYDHRISPRRASAITGARFSGSPENLIEASAALPMISLWLALFVPPSPASMLDLQWMELA